MSLFFKNILDPEIDKKISSIAPAKAEIGFPFARIGLTMESCSSFFLPRMVGYSKATYLLATGKRFSADSDVLSGIFAELVPEPEDVLPQTCPQSIQSI